MKSKWENVLFVIVLFVIVVFKTVTAVERCCPSEHIVLKKNATCWEPTRNTTAPVSLNCVNTLSISSGYMITDEGVLMIRVTNTSFRDVDAKFCIANGTSRKDVNLTRVKELVLVCTGDDEKILDDRVLGYCIIVSVLFLALTTFIYILCSELRDLQGKSIINFCGSLAIGLAILAFMKLGEYSDMNLCAARGFFAYFFVIASFFWSNAISIQILLSTKNPITITDYGWRDFLWYVVYAWSAPTVLTICVIIANYHPGDHERPGIGLNHCWFFGRREQWYYMYSIMSILLAINILIFMYTSTIIWRHKFSSRQLKALRYKFGMTLRLIILMGLPWVFEMISSLSKTHIIWTILDVFNSLQGFLIFLLLVVFRKRVVKSMYKRGWLECISGLVDKYLAVADDDEDNVIQHTDVPMSEK